MNHLLWVEAPISLHMETAFHLGTGHSEGLIDRTVRLTAAGEPYIPATALKGALRETAERIVGQLNQIMRNEGFEEEQLLGLRRRAGQRLKQFCRAPWPETMCQDPHPCVLCRIFGNVFTGERLLVDDARMEHSNESSDVRRNVIKKYPDLLTETDASRDLVETHTRVHIDRRRRGAKEHALFTTAYVQRANVFTSLLSGHLQVGTSHPDSTTYPLESILLAATLKAMDQIGADASTGRGRCRIEVDRLVLDDNEIDIDELVRQLDLDLLLLLLDEF